jgi:hypothetical protein
VRRAFIACACHFVVIREALTAAMAGSEPKSLDHLNEAIGRWSQAVYDRDVRTLEMTDGFLKPAPQLAGAPPGPSRYRQ